MSHLKFGLSPLLTVDAPYGDFKIFLVYFKIFLLYFAKQLSRTKIEKLLRRLSNIIPLVLLKVLIKIINTRKWTISFLNFTSRKMRNNVWEVLVSACKVPGACGLLLLISGDWQVASHNPFWARVQSWSPPNEGVFQQLPAMTRHRLTCPSTFLLNWFVSILNKVGCLHVLIDRHVDGGWWRQLASAHVFLINILRLGFIWSDQVDIE